MYFIIELEDQLDRLYPKDDCFVHLITNNDSYHPKLSTPSLVYYNDGEKGYILCIKHSESFSIPFSKIQKFINSHDKVYVMDKKFHSYFFNNKKLVDLNYVSINQTNKPFSIDCDTPTKKDFYYRFGIDNNINEIVPISKHYESAECLYISASRFFGLEGDLNFYDRLVEAYKYVEEQGIKFLDGYRTFFGIGAPSFFENSGILYSSYNMYNLTGRPTNTFNGLNFLAIPKTEEARSLVVPKNDFFVEFDFDAYHPRLISKLVGVELPEEHVYTYLAKQYFQKEEVTQDDYSEAKTITFKQLYGVIEDRYKHIEFFSKTQEYIDREYDRFRRDRAYVLPSGRLIKYEHTINRTKLFNYIIQNYETVQNVEKILTIKEALTNKRTQLVMVTYDAFLIDFDVKDGQKTLTDIKSILQEGGFSVKHKYSKNYNLK